MTKLEIRKLKGLKDRALSPGFSYCHRCGRTWNKVEGHTTNYTESSGMFPLCEICWGELKPKARLPYYRTLFDSWMMSSMQDGYELSASWADVEEAVLSGK